MQDILDGGILLNESIDERVRKIVSIRSLYHLATIYVLDHRRLFYVTVVVLALGSKLIIEWKFGSCDVSLQEIDGESMVFGALFGTAIVPISVALGGRRFDSISQEVGGDHLVLKVYFLLHLLSGLVHIVLDPLQLYLLLVAL